MKHLEELKEVVKRELEKFGKQGDISVSNLDKIHKLSDLYKNLCKIEMLEEEAEGGYSEARGGRGGSYMHGSSYDDDMLYSERRGRNAKRDSMGRYSRDDAKDAMMNRLGEMMEDADPKEREALKECMRAIERA
jgi:curved DNA-binding protein CbpA